MEKGKIHRTVAYTLFATIVCAYGIMAVQFPLAYIVATYEDLVGEWAQVFLFAAALLFSVRLAAAKSEFRVFFAVLALACLYVILEEISWGQRLFGIATPEFFRTHNLQQETNLHNFLTGPMRTATKTGIEYAMATGMVVYGLVYPLALQNRWPLATWTEAKGIPAPPLYVWPFFVLSAPLELRIFRFNEAEIAEVLIPLGLALFAMHYWVAHKNRLAVHRGSSWDRSVSVQLAVKMVVVFACVLTLSFATTYACYATPRLRAGMEDRFLNGVEKFAERYKRYEQWDTAAGLYLLVHRNEPGRTSVLRKLATCYSRAGDQKSSAVYSQRAIDLDLDRLASNPDEVSDLLSLARTYRQLGDQDAARDRLNQALQSASEWVVEEPANASAAYWLGKTYGLMGDYHSALVHLQKASAMHPTSIKYRKAVRRARRLAGSEGQHDDQEGRGEG